MNSINNIIRILRIFSMRRECKTNKVSDLLYKENSRDFITEWNNSSIENYRDFGNDDLLNQSGSQENQCKHFF